MKTIVHFLLCLAHLFLEWDVSDKSCREKQNTHYVLSNFFSKIVPFMAHAHCMLET
jgi:hypothetical protein